MHRRAYLSTVAGATTVGLAGCLGGGNPNVALPEPDREADSEAYPYRAWGQRVPDVTLQAPLEEREVAVRDLDEPCLFGFIYTTCVTVCPVITSTLRNVHTHALNEGYAGEIGVLPVTYDPARDTAARLREYAAERNIDPDAPGWTFLRPASEARAERVVKEEFGVFFEKREPTDAEPDTEYMFTHAPIVMLVNADGYVERAYRTKTPDPETIVADLAEVRRA
jgi:protein SCO1/2